MTARQGVGEIAAALGAVAERIRLLRRGSFCAREREDADEERFALVRDIGQLAAELRSSAAAP